MKTIILYATKHGATEEIAKRIAARIDGAIAFDLKQGSVPALEGFDCVIVGSAIYAGTFRKEAKSFLAENSDVLCKKRLGLFISGMSESESDEAFKANIPEEVVQAAVLTKTLGGAFDPKRANFFERLIMKAVAKQSGYVDKINDEKIDAFAEAMKQSGDGGSAEAVTS